MSSSSKMDKKFGKMSQQRGERPAVGKNAAGAHGGVRRDHRRVHPAGNRYFTVNGADAVTFSHSTSSFPLAPPAHDSVILRVSTGDDGLAMVSEARPSSVAGSSVVAPSRMPSGDTPTPQMWRAPAIRVLLTISFHCPLSRSAYRV